MMNLEIPVTLKIHELIIKIRNENPGAEYNHQLIEIFEETYRCKVIYDKWGPNGIRFKTEQDLVLFLLKV